MARSFAIVLLVSLYTAPHAHALDFGQKECGPELNAAYKNFLRETRINNFKTGATSGSGKEAKRFTTYLKRTHKKIVKHEEAHKTAAGKWGGEIKYMYFTWWNIPYAVAGCHIPKRGMPLEVALKSLLAPDQPSKWDLQGAEKIKAILAARKTR